MNIVCISDTHIEKGNKGLPAALLEALSGADLILHAGDITSLDVIDELKTYAPVEAVAGNMDGWEVSNNLPEKRIIQAGKFKIGLIHGGGSVRDLEDRVIRKFRDDKVDCIVYGHSHRANIEKRDNILLVNPGSPTDRAHAPWNSYAVITVDEELKAEIVRL
ncbi:MAG: metallophosphoesterase family protein [Nitrospirota bacterium]